MTALMAAFCGRTIGLQRLGVVAVFFAMLALPGLSAALNPLSDEDMAVVLAQDGIALEIEFAANMEPHAPSPGGWRAIQAAPFNSCVGNNNPCRMDLTFAERPGAWIAIKDYYGYIGISDMLLDVGQLNTGPGGIYPGNMSQFEDEAGVCLLNGNPAGCSSGDLDGEPALQISFPSTRARTDFVDIRVTQNMGRVSGEYDVSGTEGYKLDNATGSVLGFRLRDNDGGPTGQRMEGRVLVFGF